MSSDLSLGSTCPLIMHRYSFSKQILVKRFEHAIDKFSVVIIIKGEMIISTIAFMSSVPVHELGDVSAGIKNIFYVQQLE